MRHDERPALPDLVCSFLVLVGTLVAGMTILFGILLLIDAWGKA